MVVATQRRQASLLVIGMSPASLQDFGLWQASIQVFGQSQVSIHVSRLGQVSPLGHDCVTGHCIHPLLQLSLLYSNTQGTFHSLLLIITID